jgi:acyl-CoA dehydrogenase family protein 9
MSNKDSKPIQPENYSAVKSLFLGQIPERSVFPYPEIDKDEAETLKIVLDSVQKFLSGKEEDYRAWDLKGEQPKDFIEALKELGLFGLIIPEEYGGIGLSNTSYSRVIQETSRFDASVSLTVGAHSSIGMKGLLLFGNEEQKKKYLPKLASGETIAAFCLTEPGAGSDAASIKTSAVKNADGSWSLSGEKIWITNGAFAGFFTVFARTESEGGKISAFIVERDWQGVSTGHKEDKMGIRASATTSVLFDNVKVPAENLLGEEGKGFKIAMEVLNNGRTGLGGGCVGGIKKLIHLAAIQATERKQFGKSISEYGLIKQKIAQMTVDCFAAESVVGMVGHLIDSKSDDYSIEAAVSKVFGTEALWKAAYEALQIAGGNGFMREYPYERVVRDCRINMIFEGTNEILRLYIALSGMKDVGKYLQGVVHSAEDLFNDPIKGFGVLSDYAARRLSRLTYIGRDRINLHHECFQHEADTIERYTQSFAAATEGLIRRYGKGVIDKQMAMKRLADISIDLFVSICVLSRASKMVQAQGEASSKQVIDIAKVFVRDARIRMTQNLRGLDRNDDRKLEEIANHIFENKNYSWDII